MGVKQKILICLIFLVGHLFAYDEICGIWLMKGETYVEKTFTAPFNQIAHFEYFGPTVVSEGALFEIKDLTTSEIIWEIQWPARTDFYYDNIWIIEDHVYRISIYDSGVNANRRPWAIVKYSID